MSGPSTLSERYPNCRLFLGNLASEKTSKEELRDIFGKYGNIIEDPVLRRSFGFIQYDSSTAALEAIKGEQGRILGGLHLDISVADNREPRKRGPGGPGGPGGREVRGGRGPDRFGRERRVERSMPYAPPSRGYERKWEKPRCQVVFLTPMQRDYAMMLERQILDRHIPCEVRFIERDSAQGLINLAYQRELNYLLFAGKVHERGSTVDLHLLTTNGPESYPDTHYQRALEILVQEESLRQEALGGRAPPPVHSAPPPAVATPAAAPSAPVAAGGTDLLLALSSLIPQLQAQQQQQQQQQQQPDAQQAQLQQQLQQLQAQLQQQQQQPGASAAAYSQQSAAQNSLAQLISQATAAQAQTAPPLQLQPQQLPQQQPPARQQPPQQQQTRPQFPPPSYQPKQPYLPGGLLQQQPQQQQPQQQQPQQQQHHRQQHHHNGGRQAGPPPSAPPGASSSGRQGALLDQQSMAALQSILATVKSTGGQPSQSQGQQGQGQSAPGQQGGSSTQDLVAQQLSLQRNMLSMLNKGSQQGGYNGGR